MVDTLLYLWNYDDKPHNLASGVVFPKSSDFFFFHKFDDDRKKDSRPLQELLLKEPELSQLGRQDTLWNINFYVCVWCFCTNAQHGNIYLKYQF